jgi:hypothetical protein
MIIFTPESKPYNMTYGEWTAKWWKWFISIPTAENPINDQSGEKCATHQVGDVWFFLGSGGGKTIRSCTIPAGKAILIPAIITECSFAEDQSLKTESDLRSCAKDDQDQVTKVWATIDGLDLAPSQVYRVQSPLFDVNFPDENVFAVPSGPTQAVSDGHWVFIKPLSPGNHNIHVGGVIVDYTVTTPSNFIEDSTYQLKVEGEKFSLYNQTVTIAGASIAIPVNSSSTISNFNLDENSKRVSFTVSGDNGTTGTTRLPISKLLVGPYSVMVDGSSYSDYKLLNTTNGETDIELNYSHSVHDVVIIGTNVVPEFPLSIVLLVVAMGGAVVLMKTMNFMRSKHLQP